ncbi:MAG: hypothetical protein QGH15_21255 [Kiritimatiellia bacterium]|jgi:hypothetical protein|nr:hypothetical protein [Kiritimatiellia bacterium]
MNEFCENQSCENSACGETPLLVDNREHATILAALRFHQAENLQGTGIIQDLTIRDIASNLGHLKTLNSEEIDQLCERINIATEGAYSRRWCCPDCHCTVTCSYDDLAEAGAPYCSDCDSEMLMI